MVEGGGEGGQKLSKYSILAITPVWYLIETWGFRVDDPCDFPDSPI